MTFWQRLNQTLATLEWRWSLGAAIWGLLFPVGSFALPAWAARATGVLSEYAPLSWVVIGFAGLLAYAIAIFAVGTGRMRSVRSRYDALFMEETGGVDPLARVFEGKRIFLEDFILPSNPFVDGKTFVECEIVGPGNIFFAYGNGANDIKHGDVDAVALAPNAQFSNGYTFTNCTFRGCTFHRVTLFFSTQEAARLAPEIDWVRWISLVPPAPSKAQEGARAIEDHSDQSPQEPEEETPR